MKLYFFQGACSFAVHVVLRELGLSFELDRVDSATKKTQDGDDFLALNPKGYVPALKLDSGAVLTEVTAILQYLADQHPGSGLLPAAGTMERARVQEWLGYTATELHKSYSPLFSPKTPDDYKAMVKEAVEKRLGWVASQLEGKTYLTGDAFTIADAYLSTVVGWSKFVGIDLSRWPALTKYLELVGERASVKAARAAERPEKKPGA